MERLARASLWWVVLAACGCETAPIYTGANGRAMIGRVPDRSRWIASGTLSKPDDAVDGNLHTAAVAPDHGSPAALTIDLGKASMFNMVVIDHGRNEFGFARQVAVSTSMDGAEFKRLHTAPGTRRVSTFLLMRPVVARYVRLEAVQPGQRPWAVAEVHFQ